MPCFEIVLSGTGITRAVALDSDPLRGFIATRRVWARDQHEAIELAREMILDDWRSDVADGRSHVNDGPSVKMESWRRLGWLAGMLGRKPAGYTLYRL